MNLDLEAARVRHDHLQVYRMATRTFITETLGSPHLSIREKYRVAIETLIASFELETSHNKASDLLADIVSRFGTYEWFV